MNSSTFNFRLSYKVSASVYVAFVRPALTGCWMATALTVVVQGALVDCSAGGHLHTHSHKQQSALASYFRALPDVGDYTSLTAPPGGSFTPYLPLSDRRTCAGAAPEVLVSSRTALPPSRRQGGLPDAGPVCLAHQRRERLCCTIC